MFLPVSIDSNSSFVPFPTWFPRKEGNIYCIFACSLKATDQHLSIFCELMLFNFIFCIFPPGLIFSFPSIMIAPISWPISFLRASQWSFCCVILFSALCDWILIFIFRTRRGGSYIFSCFGFRLFLSSFCALLSYYFGIFSMSLFIFSANQCFPDIYVLHLWHAGPKNVSAIATWYTIFIFPSMSAQYISRRPVLPPLQG